MLILTRKPEQRLFIGNEIVVTVICTDRGRVKLGIEAPAHLEIWREEIAPEDHPALRRSTK